MGEARRRRGRAPGPLPRGTCPVCGNEFALRATRTLGQHQRRTPQGYRVGRCPGVGQPPIGLKTVDNTVTVTDVTAGQTPEITISSATEDTDPEPRSTPVHDVTTETRLRALDEKITPLYEYLGQRHAADIAPGEGPIEMALRLLREQDARLQASPSNVTAADREDQHAADTLMIPAPVPHGRAHEGTPRHEIAGVCHEIEPTTEQSDDDPVPTAVWTAVAAAVPITAVAAALGDTANAAWNVSTLVERGVRAALAAATS